MSITNKRKYTLDNNQLSRLIENNYLHLTNDDILQVHDGELVLNRNGEIYNTVSIKLKCIKYETTNRFIYEHIKKLICNYLNLEPSQVIYYTGGGEEYKFRIRFEANIEYKILVCTFNQAITRTNELSDDVIDADISNIYIGLYRKLGSSPYYFRWITSNLD